MIAVVGSLARDRVEDGPERAGGAPAHCARALRLLDRPARILAKCHVDDRTELDLPVTWLPAADTHAFSFSYRGDERLMAVDAVGDPWRPEEVADLDAEWVHVGALTRSDFPAETLAELARGRRLSLDGQGLVRPARTGPLVLDDAFDRGALRHISILKLAEEEAAVAGDPAGLGVPEVIVTHGSAGATVVSGGAVEEIPAEPVPTDDPTGSGDAFAIAYLAARSDGAEPVEAARSAAALVSALLLR